MFSIKLKIVEIMKRERESIDDSIIEVMEHNCMFVNSHVEVLCKRKHLLRKY